MRITGYDVQGKAVDAFIHQIDHLITVLTRFTVERLLPVQRAVWSPDHHGEDKQQHRRIFKKSIEGKASAFGLLTSIVVF